MTTMTTPMENTFLQPKAASQPVLKPVRQHAKRWVRVGSVLAATLLLGIVGARVFRSAPPASQAGTPLLTVAVSEPLKRDLATRLQFLGQFSAVDRVELRAQVGGTLTRIGFKDGDVVHKGDLLFEIDPTPYEIRLSMVTAQLASANARLDLATKELNRANDLRRTNVNTAQDIDQRMSEKQAAQASVEDAKAMIQDARFDLDRCRITAPFTGQIGNHFVSTGNLIAGSRAGSSPTTLLATVVSLDPIYFDFDMSEADHLAFVRQQAKPKTLLTNKVYLSLSDETRFGREGTLDFVDNALNRSSGTIHARATVPNSDGLLTPGGFARVRLMLSEAAPTLLVPDASVLPDQSGHIVLTVGTDNVVAPKTVQLGELQGGLRVIRAGLVPTDRVIIDGIPTVAPGLKVSPTAGSIVFNSEQD